MKTKTDATLERYSQFVLGNYPVSPLTLVRGEGAYVWDERGRRFLDFTTGIAVNALGHAHPKWVDAVSAQAAQLGHVSNLFRNPQQANLAEALCRRAGPGRVFFCNSGTEANEGLIKFSRLYGLQQTGEEGKRHKIITFEDGFHGRTFGGVSATPQEKVRKGLAPYLPSFEFASLNDLESVKALIDEGTIAVFLETIQGEGGIRPATAEFLRELRALCDEHDLLLLIDEVQCGAGRTGDYFAFEFAGITPDAIGMAKGLGGGFPIGAFWVHEKHREVFHVGSHGTTFGGNPLACAAALAVLEVLEEDNLLEQVTAQSAAWHEQLAEVQRRFPEHLVEIRGRGYMVGLQVGPDFKEVLGGLRDRGLLAVGAGGNTVRLLPPLNASMAELEASVAILESTFIELSAPVAT